MMTLPDTVVSILAKLESAGFAAYAVGGAIRDLIRGVPPHDWDLTTAATPEQVLEVFKGETIVPTGLKHGTLTLVIDHIPYEITTFRGEVGYSDHRRPDEVHFLDSIEADLARRDFTAGAIAYSPTRGLCDPYGGVQDVQKGILRAVGDPMTRFEEDGLRILRALRFASACGFTIEERTARALHEGKQLIEPIAVERIYSELTRMLCGSGVEQVLLDFGDVIAVAIPELAPLFGYLPPHPDYDRDLWAHTAASVASVYSEPVLRWTMLLHDLALPSCLSVPECRSESYTLHPQMSALLAENVFTRLKSDRATMEAATQLIARHETVLPTDRGELHRLAIRLGKQLPIWLLLVQRADLKAKTQTRERSLQMRENISILARLTYVVDFLPLSVRDLAVGGKDLLELGYRGKEIGESLERLLMATTEGLPNTREDLLAHLATL